MPTKTLSINTPSPLAWVPNNPTWKDMVVSGRVLIQTYTLRNVSNQSISIQDIGFTPGRDSRLRITGGTCNQKGLILKAKACATIQVEMDPHTLGQVEQSLYIQPVGASALRSRIRFSVVMRFNPISGKEKSILIDDTAAMDRIRRLAEQDGHRRFSRVHARDHNHSSQQPGLESAVQNSIPLHPYLDKQVYDGMDNTVNPTPSLNPGAQEEYTEQRQEQELQKQLNLNLQPQPSTAPRPKGPF